MTTFKRTGYWTILAMAGGVCYLLLVRPATGQIIAPHGWEYARLTESPALATLEAGGHATESKGAAGEQTADRTFDIYHRLGGQHLRDGFTTVDLLNLLGQDGWELVNWQRQSADAGAYVLKRPIR
jgi:hypothetical protein